MLHCRIWSSVLITCVGGASLLPGTDNFESRIDWNDECSVRQDVLPCNAVSLLQLHARKTMDVVDDFDRTEIAKSSDSGRRRKSSNSGMGRRRRRRRRKQSRSMGRGSDGDDDADDEDEDEEVASLSDADLVADLGLCDSGLDFAGAQVVHSNLGGVGPDAGDTTLVYGNVMKGINLIVSATSAYSPNTLNAEGGALRNGVHQGFGVINMASDSSVDLKFSFVDSNTGAPKVMESFLFTFFDGDHGMSHQSREAVTVSGFSAFKVKDDETSLEILETATDDDSLASGGGVATFTSTMNGGKAGNPISPMNLNSIQEQKTVVFLFEDKSEFLVTAGESGYAKAQGRNILFAGASGLVCEEETKCSSMTCPAGSRHSPDAEFNVCSSIPCSNDDIERCCIDEE